MEVVLSGAAVALVTEAHVGTTTALIVALVALVALWLFFNPRPELSLALLLIYLGALDLGFIKLKTGSSTITIGRDLFLWLIALGMLARKVMHREPLVLPRGTAFVLLFVAIVLMQTLNPASAGIRADIGGFRQHIWSSCRCSSWRRMCSGMRGACAPSSPSCSSSRSSTASWG